ncbi:MAG: glycosyltransferase [Clostridia bacterium]|nr:glycosyltransferase [Clostridia bacterium]
MKILIINSVCGIGSTGRICTDIAREFEKNGDEVKIAYGRSNYVPEQFRKYSVKIGNGFDVKMHVLKTRLTDKHGLGSKRATRKFLKWAEEYNPNLLWLHNLHGYYINYELLFKWIKSRPEMQVKWTLHDCWAFTGHCSYFTISKCEQWKTHCSHCIQKKNYPSSIKDSCNSNFERKKQAFTGVKNMTFITPSKWLANLVKQSFLREYDVEIHYNTINTDVFKPTQSDFREKYCLQNLKVVLGVASVWNERKGLDDFIKLAAMLDDKYKIVLVGLNKKQIKSMPKNILGIERTNNPEELAAIYTAADVFLNLTYEDNYPTVNLEAQACGTQCITYRTGGSVESVPAENVVEQGDLKSIVTLLAQI